MADDKGMTDTTTTTTTTETDWLEKIKTTFSDLFKNEYVKLGAAGVGGFVGGYVTRLIQGWFSKS